ncbi:unnamed protein product [Closterium sp. NIES-54]
MGGALAKPKERDAKGKVVLITGCSNGGIGYAIAEEFQRRGANVFATSRRVDTMKGLKEKGVHTLPLDVTSEPSIQAAVKEVARTAGRVDVLVNNAGCGLPGPLAELPVARIKEVLCAAGATALPPHPSRPPCYGMQRGEGVLLGVEGFMVVGGRGAGFEAPQQVRVAHCPLRPLLRRLISRGGGRGVGFEAPQKVQVAHCPLHLLQQLHWQHAHQRTHSVMREDLRATRGGGAYCKKGGEIAYARSCLQTPTCGSVG